MSGMEKKVRTKEKEEDVTSHRYWRVVALKSREGKILYARQSTLEAYPYFAVLFEDKTVEKDSEGRPVYELSMSTATLDRGLTELETNENGDQVPDPIFTEKDVDATLEYIEEWGGKVQDDLLEYYIPVLFQHVTPKREQYERFINLCLNFGNASDNLEAVYPLTKYETEDNPLDRRALTYDMLPYMPRIVLEHLEKVYTLRNDPQMLTAIHAFHPNQDEAKTKIQALISSLPHPRTHTLLHMQSGPHGQKYADLIDEAMKMDVNVALAFVSVAQFTNRYFNLDSTAISYEMTRIIRAVVGTPKLDMEQVNQLLSAIGAGCIGPSGASGMTAYGATGVSGILGRQGFEGV